MDKKTVGLVLGGLLCGTSVAMGAWVSHGADALLTASQIASLRIAVSYQFWHGLALLIFWIISQLIEGLALRVASGLIAAGVLMFSGSIWMLTLFNQGWMWPVTPLGGVCLLLGWLNFVWSVLRAKRL